MCRQACLELDLQFARNRSRASDNAARAGCRNRHGLVVLAVENVVADDGYAHLFARPDMHHLHWFSAPAAVIRLRALFANADGRVERLTIMSTNVYGSFNGIVGRVPAARGR